MSGAAPALVILAAGASARLGTTKALVRLRERDPATPLALLLEASAGVFAGAPPLVVTGADHAAIAAALPAGVEVAENPRWRAGRTGSVQLAARARAERDLCLAQVDTPLVERAVFEALERAWTRSRSPGRGWLAPCTERDGRTRFGHPVVVGRELLGELLRFPPDRPLSELRRAAVPLLSVAVASDAILDDLDGPEELEALRRRLAPQGSARFPPSTTQPDG